MSTYSAQQLKEIADASDGAADTIFNQLMTDMAAAANRGEYELPFPTMPSQAVHDLVVAKIQELDTASTDEYDLVGAGDPIVYTLIKWDNPTGE